MGNGREQGGWRTRLDSNGSQVTVVPMSAANAAAIALQYTGEVGELQAKLDAPGVTAVVIEKGINRPLRTSITAQLGRQTDANDIAIADLYLASAAEFQANLPSVILERIGMATFTANGAAVIDGVGVSADPTQAYYPASVSLTSDLRVEARSKVALDSSTGRSPATVEITDPGECGALVAVLRKHASNASVATAALVWKSWE